MSLILAYQIHQDFGCINFGKAEVYKFVSEPLPFIPSAQDPPIFCPFFTKINDKTAAVSYSAVAASQEMPIGKQIAKDIAEASFTAQLPTIDRVFLFLWENANTLGDTAKVSYILVHI